jgi:hypothetical protein
LPEEVKMSLMGNLDETQEGKCIIVSRLQAKEKELRYLKEEKVIKADNSVYLKVESPIFGRI